MNALEAEARRRLFTQLSLHEARFLLVFVTLGTRSAANRLLAGVAAFAAARGAALRVDVPRVEGVIPLANEILEASPPWFWWLAQVDPRAEANGRLLAALNQRRDRLRDASLRVLCVEAAPAFLAAVRHLAPDLFAVRGAAVFLPEDSRLAATPVPGDADALARAPGEDGLALGALGALRARAEREGGDLRRILALGDLEQTEGDPAARARFAAAMAAQPELLDGLRSQPPLVSVEPRHGRIASDGPAPLPPIHDPAAVELLRALHAGADHDALLALVARLLG